MVKKSRREQSKTRQEPRTEWEKPAAAVSGTESHVDATGDGINLVGHGVKTCVVWVPRGVPKLDPELCLSSDDEMSIQPAKRSPEVEKAAKALRKQLRQDNPTDNSEHPIDKELHMDTYDDDDGMDSAPLGIFSVTDQEFTLAQKGDPLLKADDEISDSDADLDVDPTIKEGEFVLAVGSVENGDEAAIETYIYNHEEGECYIHHETIVHAFPTCLEVIPKLKGRDEYFLACGTVDKDVTIWDNDHLEVIKPICTLPTQASVTSLHLNPDAGHLLAAGLADAGKIIVWDLNTNEEVYSTKLHQGNVKSVKWHPKEKDVLATAGDDETVRVFSTTDSSKSVIKKFGASVESICWYRHNPKVLLIALADGVFVGLEVDMMHDEGGSKVLWHLQAFDADDEDEQALLDVSDTLIPGLVATCGENGEAQVWDIREKQPRQVATRNCMVGELFSCKATADPKVPTLLALTGSQIVIWDLAENASIMKSFALNPH